MYDELQLDFWLTYFKHQLERYKIEAELLSNRDIHARLEGPSVNGSRDTLLDNAREVLREMLYYQVAMDDLLRLCRNTAKTYEQKGNTRYKELHDLCVEIHKISIPILHPYYKEQDFLEKVLTHDEYEGLHHDVIDDLLLIGKKMRGEV